MGKPSFNWAIISLNPVSPPEAELYSEIIFFSFYFYLNKPDALVADGEFIFQVDNIVLLTEKIELHV